MYVGMYGGADTESCSHLEEIQMIGCNLSVEYSPSVHLLKLANSVSRSVRFHFF